MRRRTALVALVLLSGGAGADDAKKDSLTVLPWTQAAVIFTPGDKSATVEYSQLLGRDFLFYVKASAPLDEETRIAAFTSENKLAKGFSGSVQFGVDQRAGWVADLEDTLKLAVEARQRLASGQIGQQIPIAVEQAYASRQGLTPADMESAALTRRFCRGADPCPAATLAREICRRLGDDACANEPDDARALAAAKATAMTIERDCGVVLNPTRSQLDRCFEARWWLTIRDFALVHEQMAEVLADAETIAFLWKALETVDPEVAKKLRDGITATSDKAKERVQIVARNLETFRDAVSRLMSRSALARRDLLLTGMLGAPRHAAQAFTIGLDVEFDSLSVYQDDLATEAATEEKYSLTLAGDYTYYASVPGLAINLRGGVGRKRDPNAEKAERCTVYPSGDMTVTGKSCDATALFRAGDAPDAKTSGFARFALIYQYGVGRSEDELIPGVELRGGWDRTGSDDSASGRLTLFATPVKGSTAARVGIALDVSYAINSDTDARWIVTPLVFLGASFSELD